MTHGRVLRISLPFVESRATSRFGVQFDLVAIVITL